MMVSVDTEEDDWGSFSSGPSSTDNIALLPRLHELFTSYGVRPTYFVNYGPLQDREAVDVLREVSADPSSEIGAHCHPWNTPPIEGPRGSAGSMMCDLPSELNRRKVAEITRLLQDEVGTRPRAFRAGRWGFGPTVAASISQLGYRLDSSVTPFIDWSSIGGPDYSDVPHAPYRFAPERPFVPDPRGDLMEVPTTIGFLHGDQVRGARYRGRLERSVLRRFKVVGLLDKLGLWARRWLSPETSTEDEMVRLTSELVDRGAHALQMTFHSCTLLPGATPFVTTTADQLDFFRRTESFLSFCREQGFEFSTVSEVGAQGPGEGR